MCEMNDFQFRIALTRTHAGFLVFLPHFFDLTEALRTTGRVGTLPTHSIQRLRATGRAVESRAHRGRKRLAHRARDGRCPAPTRKPAIRSLPDDQKPFVGTESIDAYAVGASHWGARPVMRKRCGGCAECMFSRTARMKLKLFRREIH